MAGINQEALRDERIKRRAQGIGRDGRANGGIINPMEITLRPGATLIRFGRFPKRKDKYRTPGIFAPFVSAGEWWLHWHDYKIVEEYADATGESVAYAVRELCAVPEEWSDMSFVVQAKTQCPLSAFIGEGRVAETRKARIDPKAPGKPTLYQLFIPSLDSSDLRRRAIFVTGYGFLDPLMARKGQRKRVEAKAAMHQRLTAAIQDRSKP